MNEPLRVLIVEDSEGDSLLVLRELRKAGYKPEHLRVDSADALQAALTGAAWDIVLADYRIPGFGGVEALTILQGSGLDIPFVLVSGQIGEEAAVEIMKAGAQDYVAKEHLSRLGPVVKRELADASARRAVKRARIEWAAAFDAVQDPIFFHDAEYRVVRANSAYARSAGMAIDAIVGKPYFEVFPRRDGPLPGCRSFDDAHDEPTEEEFALPSGETYTSRAFRINDEHGRPVYSLHVLQDVTERQRVLEALARSERYSRKLIAGSADVFLVVDSAAKVKYLSASSNRFSGLKDHELIGTPLLAQVVAEDRPRAEKMFEEARASQNGWISADLRLINRGGESIHFETQTRNLLADPDVGGIVITLHDITERILAETTIRKVNRALRTLIAGAEALIHAGDEAALLTTMCRSIVEVGGYHLAWVGYARDDAAQSVEIVACSSPDLIDAQTTRMSWRKDAPDQGATGGAICTGSLRMLNDLEHEPRFAAESFREAVLKAGAKSLVAFPLTLDHAVFGSLAIACAEPAGFEPNEMKVLEQLAGDLAYGIGAMRARVDVGNAAGTLRRSLESTIAAIAALVESRDPYTAGHERRVALLAEAIARELALPNAVVEGIHFGALIHDVGKVQVPAEILSKPGRLSTFEFELVKTHSQVGYTILAGIDFPWPVAETVLQHHERLDGSGYPRGLKGEAILLEARIIAVADVVEAMSSHRPYRATLGIEAALAEIERGRGTAYDPAAVDACLRLFRERGYALPD